MPDAAVTEDATPGADDAPAAARAIARFVPRFARDQVAGSSTIASCLDVRLSGAILVADIAGFSALTEHKARLGQAGIEEMQNLLNRCFDRIVSTLTQGGGQICRFAGDATIAYWPAGRDPHALRTATHCAAATALRLQALIPELAQALQTPLRLRIGIGAGKLFSAVVGGHQGRWEALLGGDALQQVAATPMLESGLVVLSPPAHALVQADCHTTVLAGGGHALDAIAPAPAPRPAAPEAPAAAPAPLAPFVPRHLLRRLRADPDDRLAELRTASVLFVIAPVPEALAELQTHTTTLQRATYANGGSVLQYLVDDKASLVFIAAWGIPGSSHPDDAERAMRTAHAVTGAAKAAGRPIGCGVASGRLFAGLRGSHERAEYALIGRVVNLAARMAQASRGQVYCDEATAHAVPAVAFEARPGVTLKGIGDARVFESLGQRRIDDANLRALVGRQSELQQLLAQLQRVVDEPGRSRLVVVEGDAGIGKSHLCAAFAQAARDRGLVLASGASDPLDHSAAYQPLRQVFDTLLGLRGMADAPARRTRVLGLLADDDATRERVSLLSEVLALALAPSATEQQMSGRGRIEATTDLLVRLLVATADTSVRIVMLEDLHWLDSASWGVLEQAVRRCPGLLVVLSTRPLADDAPCAELLRDPAHLHLRLAPLQASAVRDIIAAELGASEVPEPVWRTVADRTQGLPLYVRQVVAALVQGRVVQCTDGAIRYDPQGLSSFTIPDTIQGVVIARIDQLTPRQQTTLKSASAIGRDFSFEALAIAAAGHGSGETLRQDLQALVAGGLVETGPHDAPYRFSHALVRDAVYSLLPLAARREFHAALGAWYERQAGDDRQWLGRIAWHWDQAHDPVRALRALEAAGNHALRTGAYREAQNLFARLVTITTRGFGEESTTAVAAPLEQAARWQANLGLASYDLGELERARTALEAAAGMLGQAVPGPHLIGLAVAREALGAAVQRWWRPAGSGEAQAARARQVAMIYSTLGRIYHLTQRPHHTVFSILRRHNLLAPHPACAEQMGAHGGMMYLCTMLGRHDWADRHAADVGELHRRLQDPLAYADANLTVALAYMGQARWEQCERSALDAEQIFHRLGERQGRMVMLAILANTAELHGAFGRAEQLWMLLDGLAVEVGDQVGQCWSAGGLAMLAIRRGEHAQATVQARRAIALARSTGEAVSYLADTGLLALSRLESGDTDQARARVDEGVALMAALPRVATAHHLLNGLDAYSELILRLWEIDAPPQGSTAWHQWSHRAAVATRRADAYARVFAIGRPMAARHRGLHLWLLGRHAKAIAAWQLAIAEGQDRGIPYETAKAHLELARHVGADDPRRREHAQRAIAIFTHIGAQAGAARARALV
ncbi:MAG: AAA family ATPase [Rhodoferax sp.]|nr:AAA family ATPase [Rhodoferax sp.]